VSPANALRTKILDAVLQPVWVVDLDGRVVFANPASVAVLGYHDASELHGRQSHDTLHNRRPNGSPYPVEECPMLAPRLTGEDGHGEDEWFIRRDGSMFPVEWWSAPIDLEDGRGAVLTFVDLTERLAAEKAEREREAAEIREAESRAAQRRLVEGTTRVRAQMARDIHDGAQQRLVALIIDLQLLREDADVGLTETLGEAIEHTAEAIDELRTLAAGMHPAILTARGLFPAVQALARRSPVPVTVHGDVPDRLDPAIEANAYYFVSEALTNVAKHAHASRIDVRLRLDDDLSVIVSDDGTGGATIDGLATGLAGLRDRVTALDGTFDLASPPGFGTTLRATIPARGSAGPNEVA